MTNADVTRRRLTLGARDPILGHCSKEFVETTIKALIVNNGNSPIALPIGMYPKYPHTAFIPDVIYAGDEIVDAFNDKYVVQAAEKLRLIDQFEGYVCNLQEITDQTDRAATSGTWHLDSESAVTDNRYRNKLYLETYITDAHLKLDDAATNADWVAMFSGADYPLKYEFSPNYNDVDLIFAIDKGNSTPMYDAYRDPYGTDEEVIIRTFAINKTGLTAINLLDQAYAELKEIFSDITHNASGTFRGITRTALKPEDLGGMTLYSEEITIRYERPNDDYTPTYPTITYGDSQASTYTFPNVTSIRYNDPDSGDAYILPPGRIGEITQILGMENFEIELTCDLTISPSGVTWLRPQATTPKTDIVPEQVFREIKFGGKTDSDQEYQNLNLGYGTVIPVRLISIDVENADNDSILQLTFKRYSATDGASGTYKTWYGISP